MPNRELLGGHSCQDTATFCVLTIRLILVSLVVRWSQLFGVDAGASERTIITDDVGYYFCIKDDDPYYEIQAQERDSASPCIIKLNGQTLGITKGSEC